MEGPELEVGRSKIRWEAQRVGSLRSMRSFPSVRMSLQVSCVLGQALGPESTKMLNTWSPPFKRGPVNKTKQCQQAEGSGSRKGHWFATTCDLWGCSSVEGLEASLQEVKMWIVKKRRVLWLFMVLTESRFIWESRLEGRFRDFKPKIGKKLRVIRQFKII